MGNKKADNREKEIFILLSHTIFFYLSLLLFFSNLQITLKKQNATMQHRFYEI